MNSRSDGSDRILIVDGHLPGANQERNSFVVDVGIQDESRGFIVIVQPPLTTTTRTPVSRAEWTWIAGVMLIGACLRLGNLNQVAVEHFDEAVYASNLLIPAEQGGEYPFRPLYAPPLLPAAIEWTTIFGQMVVGDLPPWWPMAPSLLGGIATIPSVWWITRRWFSPRTGILAALLLATNEFHAAYCRTALTDVLLPMFILWAVYWFWIALQSGRTQDAMVAGVFTSLAWWTKYNGWLPLAIAVSGGVFWQWLTDRSARNWSRLGRVWLTGAATAFVLWLPVLWDCRKVGGYAKVAENHRGYFGGPDRWPQNMIRGWENFDEFVGWITLVGLLLAIAMRLAPSWDRFAPIQKTDLPSGRLLAECLAGAWFWGLFVATPMYHPYSRLWTPWLLASAILLAETASAARRISIGSLAELYRASLMAAGVGCGVMIACAAVSGRPPIAMPANFERRDGMADAATRIRQLVSRDDDTFLVIGDSDPAIWFNLRRQGIATLLSSTFEFADGRRSHPRYLVLGPHCQKNLKIADELQRRRERFELIEEFPISSSRVALLDLVSAAELASQPERRQLTVQVYRVRN